MPEPTFTLAVLTKNRTNPAYAGARAGVDRALARLGGRALHLVPERPDDVGQQIALVHEALAARPQAILMCPTHPTRLSTALDAIVAARVPLFFFVGANALPEGIELIKAGKMVATAAFDAMSMGALAAEAAARALRGESVPARIELTVQMVDAANLSAWDRDYVDRVTVPWASAVARSAGPGGTAHRQARAT